MNSKTLTMKKPTQKRSRERVNVILKTATAIIAHSGSEGLQMNDLARAAKVPIGSLYQYFPSKQSVVLALVDRFLGRVREQIELAFEEIRDRETAIQVIKATIWNYYQTCLKEPAIRDIWCYSQSDRQLQMIDLKDTRRNAALVFIALAPYALPERHEELKTRCMLNMELTGATIRLALACTKEEGDALVEEFINLIAGSLSNSLAQ